SHGVARAGGPDPGARRVVEPGGPGGRAVLRLRGRMVPGRAGSARRQRGPGATDGADPLGARRRGRVRPGVSLRTGVDRQSLGDRCAQRRGLLAADGPHGLRAMTPERFREAGRQAIDWLVDMLALPDRFKSSGQGGGVIQDTASSASLCALLAARERATAFRTNDTGVDRVLTAYTSTQAHSSLEKAAGIAGIGRRHVRAIEVDAG